MEDAEHHGGPRGLDRSGVGQEGFARSGVQSQVVIDAAEPPHGVGVRGEVVRGELVGRNRVEKRRGSGPVLCRVGPSRLGRSAG